MNTPIPANAFIMDCYMRPMKRFNPQSDYFLVFTPNSLFGNDLAINVIGTYHPTGTFKPIPNWELRYSKKLKHEVFREIENA